MFQFCFLDFSYVFFDSYTEMGWLLECFLLYSRMWHSNSCTWFFRLELVPSDALGACTRTSQWSGSCMGLAPGALRVPTGQWVDPLSGAFPEISGVDHVDDLKQTA